MSPAYATFLSSHLSPHQTAVSKGGQPRPATGSTAGHGVPSAATKAMRASLEMAWCRPASTSSSGSRSCSREVIAECVFGLGNDHGCPGVERGRLGTRMRPCNCLLRSSRRVVAPVGRGDAEQSAGVWGTGSSREVGQARRAAETASSRCRSSGAYKRHHYYREAAHAACRPVGPSQRGRRLGATRGWERTLRSNQGAGHPGRRGHCRRAGRDRARNAERQCVRRLGATTLRIPTKWPTQSDGNGPPPSEAAWRPTRGSGSAPEDHLLIDGLRVVWQRPATLAIGGLAAGVRAGAGRRPGRPPPPAHRLGRPSRCPPPGGEFGAA
jgi:hypothetical protein